MKNNIYWNNRHKQWLNNQAKMDVSTTKKLEKEYVRTANELEKEIASYFQRYGKDNVIEFRTMMQGLDKTDHDMLFKDMEAFAEKYPEYAHLMPVRESVYKLNRLQGLHYSTQMKLLELGAIEQKELEKHLEKTYGKRYEQVMKELGLGSQFLSINRQLMQNTIYAKWVNNENFSQRIWRNKNKLLNHLTTKYRDGLARGDNYETLTKNIIDRFNVAYNDAKRLVWTEASFVYNQSHTQAYKQAGVEEYELTAIMDSRTSKICRSMDGKRFKFDEMEVGVNFPPFHSWCRTTFIGVLDEHIHSDFILTEDEERAINQYISSDSYKINHKLRCGLTLNDSDRQIMKYLDAAFNKVSRYEGDLTRSLYFSNLAVLDEFLETHQPGEIKTYDEYISTTKGYNYNPDGQVQLYILDAKLGHDLSVYNPSEQEILYSRGSKFEIKAVEKIKGTYHILMEEIDG